ncbi:MAG: hypothetical protein LW847_08030 [Burkholderiales bacterium]|jgi:hypothetical protein|nr:hypothetical protein [Burkholderiales bacterium]
MLNISAEQMARIGRARLERVLYELVPQLQAQYPDAPPAAELRAAMQPLLERMLGWNIHSGGFLALHVLASKVVGEDYYTLPGFEAVFAAPGLSEDLKEEWLRGWLAGLRDSA